MENILIKNCGWLFSVFFILCSCSQSENHNHETTTPKHYTVQTNTVPSQDSMIKELNGSQENIQSIKYELKMSVINLNQKKSNFEYELKKVIAESKAVGVDYRESYKSIQNEQREDIKLDRESIRIKRSMLEDEIVKYNNLLAKYNSLYGEKPTNEVERVYSGGFRISDSNDKYDIHKGTLKNETNGSKSTE